MVWGPLLPNFFHRIRNKLACLHTSIHLFGPLSPGIPTHQFRVNYVFRNQFVTINPVSQQTRISPTYLRLNPFLSTPHRNQTCNLSLTSMAQSQIGIGPNHFATFAIEQITVCIAQYVFFCLAKKSCHFHLNQHILVLSVGQV